jgi:ATP-binding cassette subfamily B protein
MKPMLIDYRAILGAYLRPLWRQSTLLLLLLLSGTGLKLLNPLIVAWFIDGVIGGQGFTLLLRLALLFLAVAILIQLISVAESYLAANIGLIATNQLRADLALHCLQLDMGFHNNRTPGELIERVDGDVGHLNNFFARFMVELLGSAMLLVGVLVALLRIDWRVGAAMTLFALLTLLVTYLLRNVAVRHFEQSRQAHAELFGFLEERLAGTEDVRALGATEYVLRRFFERSRSLFRKDLSARMIGAGSYSVMIVLFAVGNIVALGAGIYLYQASVATIGTVYLIFRYTELLSQPIEQIGRQLQDLQRAGAAILRIQGILSTQAAIKDEGERELPAGALGVCYEQVSFGYVDGSSSRDNGDAGALGDELVLHDLHLSLAPGEVLGLLGRTGSGKTTLTRLLLRLYDPTQGQIRLSNVPLRQVQTRILRQRVAVVTQEIQLFHASLRNNLTLFAPDIPDERIYTVLHDLGLWPWYEMLPAGLDTLLAPGGGGLSAGEAQLLAFVRIFLKDPAVVILDEASSRLDPVTEQLLEHAVERLLAGRTAIIIAHRLATVQRANSIMILEQGRCLEYGPRLQLAADPNSRFAQLLRTGMEEALV